MGFAWIVTLILTGWVAFTLGRRYQDLQDIILARRIAKLIKQRNEVAAGQRAYEELEHEQVAAVKERKQV